MTENLKSWIEALALWSLIENGLQVSEYYDVVINVACDKATT